MSAFTNTIENILNEFKNFHPEELSEGKLKVCIGGGAGFIGSHIAQYLKAAVSSFMMNYMPSLTLFVGMLRGLC